MTLCWEGTTLTTPPAMVASINITPVSLSRVLFPDADVYGSQIFFSPVKGVWAGGRRSGRGRGCGPGLRRWCAIRRTWERDSNQLDGTKRDKKFREDEKKSRCFFFEKGPKMFFFVWMKLVLWPMKMAPVTSCSRFNWEIFSLLRVVVPLKTIVATIVVAFNSNKVGL